MGVGRENIMNGRRVWTIADLEAELKEYEQALRAAGKSENTVQTYVDRPARFLRWRAGAYNPAPDTDTRTTRHP